MCNAAEVQPFAAHNGDKLERPHTHDRSPQPQPQPQPEPAPDPDPDIQIETAAVPSPSMEPFGAGAPEIRLYRRPSYGAPLVELAALGLVAQPRLLEVVSDATGEEVDGEPSRRPGLYLALVQGGAVVDVARLASYAGQTAGLEDLEEDYWLNGSDTSQDWRTRSGSSSSGTSNSEQHHGNSSSDGNSSSGGRGSEDLNDKSTRSRSSNNEQHHGNSSSGGEGSEDHNDKSTRSRSSSNGTSSSEEQQGNISSGSSEDQDTKSSRGTSSTSQDQGSSYEMKGDQQERTEDDLSSMGDLTISNEVESDGADVYGYEGRTVDVMEKSSSDDETDVNNSSSSWNADEETDIEYEDAAVDEEDAASEDEQNDAAVDEEDAASDDEQNADDEEEDADDEEDAGDGDEEDAGGDEEEGDAGDDDEEGDADDDMKYNEVEQQCRSVKLKLRIWLAQMHISVKIFCGQKWMVSKVHRLTWVHHEELEELFNSSFKLDISNAITTNTVFGTRECYIDFEGLMVETSSFDELIDEFKSSVRDFKFCTKLGGEMDCRVFKCLSHGSIFALKTLCLEESCITEPREIEVLSSFKDKRIMAFYQAWIEPWSYKNGPISEYLFIQLELCKSTLKDKLFPQNFESSVYRWHLFEEMAKGLKTTHDELVVHRDLKPENVFFGSDMRVLIGDFGDACVGHDDFGGYGGTPNLGTQLYAAPELSSAEKITDSVDMYSLGVMVLEIFTRFKTEFERLKLLGRLGAEGLPGDWEEDRELTGDREGLRGVLQRMIAPEPAYRPSVAEILDYLQKQPL